MAVGFLLHAPGSYLVTQDGSRLIISFDPSAGKNPYALAAQDGLTSTRAAQDGLTSTSLASDTAGRTRGWRDGQTTVDPGAGRETRTRDS